MKYFQKGFNYSQDGPGNRLVYHLQGCNFRCPWCSNPEGMGAECNSTAECSADEIYEEILRCKPMFFDGGGVTFTGGEVSLQGEELLPLFRRLREAHVDICIETNGSHPNLPVLWREVDRLIMDIKHYDRERHRYFTGVDGEAVFRNFGALCKERKEALIRIPLIHKINTDAEEFVRFFEHYDCTALSFEFLPYHEYGKVKWTEEYTVKDGFVREETLREFEEKFTAAGLRLITT